MCSKYLKNENIREQLAYLPVNSGCYLYHDKNDEIIYVGKAKNLKRRVSSYFNKNPDSAKLRVLVPKISRIEYIVTDTEIEALILESHLIKKYKPRYNILLKDDKKFPYFVVTDEDYPRIIIARKSNLNMAKGKYFGPYTDSRAMYTTLELMKKIFPLKQCKTPKFHDRPCMYYQIGRCLAPCQKKVSSEDYKKLIKSVELFLSGKQQELAEKLLTEMNRFSEKQEFEKAARFRDSYLDVTKTLERQKVVFENTNIDNDIVSVSSKNGIFAVVVLQIRGGRLINRKDFPYIVNVLDTEEEIIDFFLKEYYQRATENEIPKKILLPKEYKTENVDIYSEFLHRKFKKKVSISVVKTNKEKELLELAKKNSDLFLDKLLREQKADVAANYNEIGAYLKEKLNLSKFPHRVECFDISHIQGTNTVASMVCFENGVPVKSKYRKFKIKSAEGKPDDFKSMAEVVTRRYKRLKEQSFEFPDLIIIDGGKGQLSSAVEILNELEIEKQDIVSLAKRLEEVFLPNKSKSVLIPETSLALHFFQQIRDEAHRFAITFHRTLRAKSSIKSELDEIKYLKTEAKALLMQKFKSVNTISTRSLQELESIVDKKSAKKVYEFFHSIE
ncbi:excinuclease ABC subunit UvrC [bacterium]|nr:excinuclease ABC subunit UvrC [bacterium]